MSVDSGSPPLPSVPPLLPVNRLNGAEGVIQSTRPGTSRARPLPMAPPVTGAGAAESPPYSLPISHFVVALGWLVAGSVGLLWAGPQLARGQWLSPVTAAVTHLFTLGWVLTSAYGALYQLSPVALGIRVRNWSAGYLTLALHAAGTAAVATGLVAWWPRLIALGWTLVALALAIWTWNVGLPLARAPRAQRQARVTGLAFAFLWLALLVAGARAGNALGWWIVPRLAIVAAHVHLAVAGFGTLLIMGVGSHILPMFLLARHAPDRPGTLAPPFLATGTLVTAAGWLLSSPVLLWAGALASAAGVFLFLVQAVLWLRHRHRDAIDPTLRQAIAALAALALAVPCGIAALITGAPRLIAAWGVLMVVGWMGLLVGAVYGRVLPFLTWLDRYRKRAGQAGVPKAGEMLSPRALQYLAMAWTASLAALATAIVLGVPQLAVAGAAAFAAASAGAALLYARLVFGPSEAAK